MSYIINVYKDSKGLFEISHEINGAVDSLDNKIESMEDDLFVLSLMKYDRQYKNIEGCIQSVVYPDMKKEGYEDITKDELKKVKDLIDLERKRQITPIYIYRTPAPAKTLMISHSDPRKKSVIHLDTKIQEVTNPEFVDYLKNYIKNWKKPKAPIDTKVPPAIEKQGYTPLTEDELNYIKNHVKEK